MKKLVFAFICLLPVITSRAQIITVDDDGPANHNNIPDAINEAIESRQDSNIVDVETIVVKPGTYNKKISFNNLAVTLTSEDPNDPNVVQATIITVSSGYSVRFDFGEDSNSVLTGFTVTGRGIHCYGTSPTISKNIIRDCETYGIQGEIQGEDNAAPVISDNTIISNNWDGIYYCNGPITNNIISENHIGLAYCHGPITNNIISYNSNMGFPRDALGGALYFCNGQITGNLIAYNYAKNKGGACYKCSGEIINNTFIGNKSDISGGALYECLGWITNNIISRNRANNGGGLSACNNKIYNNTIVGNIADEKGGALGHCYGYVRNNIIAFNKADSVGGIFGGSGSSHNVFWSNEGGNFGGGATAGTDDIDTNPLFASDGYWDNNETPDESDDFWVDGDYHVKSQAGRWDPNSQSWVQDDVTSPCIDAGDPNLDWTAELWPHGKRINVGVYGRTVEASMSLSNDGNVADLDPDVNDVNDWVDYSDMMLLANQWLSEVNELPLAEDLDRSGTVDFADFAILINNWRPVPNPPTPNPMTWATEPHATSRTTIAMEATTATSTDSSGVEYFFDCNNPDVNDSRWQGEPNYIFRGLTPSTEYSYRVKARNKANLIETVYSETRSATTLPEDTTPPEPNPMAWKTEPHATQSRTTIAMEAITAYDESGVEYHFECTSHPAYSSEWQDSPEYETDPLPDGMYSFVVRARDKSPNQNTTDPSIPPVTADLQPPEPNPMQWEEKPHETYGGGGKWDYYAEMTAVEATDPSGGVKYYFQCKSDSGFDSGWQSSRTYKVLLGRSGLAYRFRVKACDAYGNETAYSEEWPAL